MIKNISTIILLVFCLGFQAKAQNSQPESIIRSNGIGFLPQYTIAGGFRFDYDRRLTPKANQWVIVSPQLFMVTNGRFGHDFKELSGFGLELKHRIFLADNFLNPTGFYFQYGPMFQHFSITDTRTFTQSYIENGVEYYTVKTGEVTTKLNKFGGNFHIGYQWLLGNKAYLDIYTGAGVRISFDDMNEGFSPWYNNSWIDYGYSGTLLDGGIRLGFYL